jgi:hypothetical protein
MVDTPQPSAKNPIVNDDGTASREFYRWIVSMWERSGGGGDIGATALQSAENLSDVESASTSVGNLGFTNPIYDKSTPGPIGAGTASAGAFTGLTATSFNAPNIGDITPGAGNFTSLDATSLGAATPGTGVFTSLDATSVDTATIGGTTPGAGDFTAVNATSVGATTPGTGEFTDLDVTGAFTATALSADANNNATAGNGALGTTATDGFLYVPTMAGAPTGVPTAKTGSVAIVYDKTNERLYVYNGAWVSAVLA